MAAINEVSDVELHIYPNADLTFAAEWWLDDDETEGQDLDGAEGQVRSTDDGTLLLDLTPHITVSGNRASVWVHSNVIEPVEWPDEAVWDFILIADTGERKQMVKRSKVRVHESVTV